MGKSANKRILVFIDIYNTKFKQTVELLLVNSFLNYINGSSIFTYEEYDEFKRDNAVLYNEIVKCFSIVHPQYFNKNNYSVKSYDYVLTLGKESAAFCGIEGNFDDISGREHDITLLNKELKCFTLPSAYLIYDTHKKLEKTSDVLGIRRLTSLIQVGINRAHGFYPVSTKGDIRFLYSLEDVAICIDHIQRSKLMAFDFETIPLILDLDTTTQKKHAVDFHKSKPTVCSFSDQPDRSWLLPMFHEQSPFLVGKTTVIDIFIVGEPNTYIDYSMFLTLKESGKAFIILKNGVFVKTYQQDLFYWNWEQVYYLFHNRDICVEKGYNNYLTEVIIPEFSKVFESSSIVKIAYNAKFDYKIAKKLGWQIKGEFEDPMMMYSTMDEVSAKSLKIISTFYYTEFQGYGDDVDYFNDTLTKLGTYAATDTYLTLRLYLLLRFELAKEPVLYRGYYNHEAPKLYHLGELEYDGMYVNRRDLTVLTERTKKIHQELEAELHEFEVVQQYTAFKRFETTNQLINDYQEKLLKEKQKTIKGLKRKIAKLQNDPKLDKSLAKQRDLKIYKKQIVLAESGEYYNVQYGYYKPGKLTREQKVLRSIEDIKNGKHKDIFTEVNFNSTEQVGEIIYLTKLQLQIPRYIKEIEKKLKSVVDNEVEKSKLLKQKAYYELVMTIGLQHPWPTVTRKLTHPITKRKYSVTEPYPSTNKNDLYDLEDDTGFIEKYLLYKAVSKLLSTYMEGLSKFLDPKNLVHTSFATVDTKRLSSRNPNLQNLPSRHTIDLVKDLVKSIKGCFQPTKGRIIAQIDLSQAELRIYSLLGGIISMQQAYLEDKDIHVKTACALLQMSEEDFYALPKDKYKMYRTWAKAANFGIIYKISPEGFQKFAKISYGIELSLKQAEEWMDRFFMLYPEIHRYHKDQIQLGERQGYVETLYGFRRHLPNIHSLNSEYRSKDARISINSPTQGTGGQMLIQSLMIAKERLIAYGYKGRFRFLNTVHDSIILEADPEVAGHVFKIVMDSCNNAPNKEYFNADLEPVPMKSDIEFSTKSWGDMVELADAECVNLEGKPIDWSITKPSPEALLSIDFTKISF